MVIAIGKFKHTLKRVAFILGWIILLLFYCSTGLRLKKQVEMETNVERVERRLKVKFPVDFVNLILNYDFGDFSILGVHFGNHTNYLETLISYHEHLSNEDIKNFSNQFISIAMGDNFTLIMNVNCGSIYVYGSETLFNNKIKGS